MKKIKRIVSFLLLLVLLVTYVPIMQLNVQAATQEEENRSGYHQLTKIDLGETQEKVKTPTLSVNRYAASTWETYSSRYFYNQMSSAQKQLYDSIYDMCMVYLTTGANAQTYDSGCGLTAPILTPAGLSQRDAEQVILTVITNNPQFYFLNEMYGMGTASNGNYVQIGMYPEWVSGITRTSATSQISSKINSWMSQINSKTDTVEKEKMAHDLIVSNTTYAYAGYDQSCAGVFLEGKAVCAGYAEAFALLCNGAGINTISVTSAEHEWNIVQLYGSWYNVDCTWDDADNGKIYYDYFNTSDQKINEGYHVVESSWDGLTVPACPSDEVPPIYNGIDYSAVYNEEYYMKKYPDIARTFGDDKTSMLVHFVIFGMSEGRQGSAEFDVNSYKNQYADLRGAFGNDLKSYYMHYVLYGKSEGRQGTGCTTLQGGITRYKGVDYSAVYDYNYYISKYSDMKKLYGNDDMGALTHFVEYGMSEGRQGGAEFDVNSYKNQYADLRRTFGNDLKSYYMHYVLYGKSEGRKGTGCTTLQGAITTYKGVDYSAVYDYNYYISKYSDMKKMYGNDDVGAIAHFVEFGMSEGRQGRAEFDVNSYRNQYVDLRSAFGNDLKSYYMHYVLYGKTEGRQGTGCTTLQGAITTYKGVDYSAVYDYNYYLSLYADMKALYGSNDMEALTHFVEYGMSEGRQGRAEFNVQVYKNNNVDLQKAFGNDLKSYYMHYLYFGRTEGRQAY